MDGDDVAQAEANSYNEWHRSLSTHLIEVMADEIKESRNPPAKYFDELNKHLLSFH